MMAESTAALPATADSERRTMLSVEQVLYAAILMGALVVRFLSLTTSPLASFEAAQAWPAWLAATFSQVDHAPQPQSALLYGLQSWLFLIAGGSDWLARLAPAAMGVALAGLPWFWRTWIGRVPALVVAALFAFDPWLVAFGRAADGTGLALFFGLLTLTALWQWRTSPEPKQQLRWERTLAVSTALLIASGVQAWSFIPVVVVFGWFFVWPVTADDRAGSLRRTSLIWFGVALAVGATGAFARPEAASALASSLTGWFAQFAAPGSAPNWPFVRLLVDQPFLAVFGPMGLILLFVTRRSRAGMRLPLFLTLWLAWGMLLGAVAGEVPFLLPMIGLPLAVAAACAVGIFADLSLGEVSLLELCVLLAVAAILLVSSAIWLATLVQSGNYEAQLFATAAILLLLTLAMWIAFGFWSGWQAAAKVAGLFFAAVLFLLTLRSSWQLNQTGGLMRPDGFFATTTLPEVRLLADDINTLSIARRGDPHEAEVQVVTQLLPDPVVGWYLRDMRNLRWVPAPETDQIAGDAGNTPAGRALSPLIVTPPGMAGDRALAGHIGSDYGVASSWTMAQLPSLPEPAEDATDGLPAEELQRLRTQQAWAQEIRPRLEWLLYRTVKQPPAIQQVTLWVTP